MKLDTNITNLLFHKNSIQYKRNSNEILYFLHILKTAGTTFTTILDHYFDYNTISPYQQYSEIPHNKKIDFSQYKLIRGHFGYGLHKILNKNLVYITMIRNPRDRIISHYSHLKYLPTPEIKDFILEDENILQVLRNPRKKILFLDNQTVSLGFDQNEINPLMEIQINPSVWDLIEQILSLKLDYSELLKKAKKRLIQFPYFGITERFEDSLFLLYYTFGWRPMKINYKLQITDQINKEQISKETDEVIQNCIKYDLELYDFAKSIFEERFLQMTNSLKKKYYESKFEKMTQSSIMYELLDKHYNDCIDRSNILQNYNIDFNFGQKMSGSGWYWRETLPDGQYYRWTGPDVESTLDFILPTDKDLKIKFKIIDEVLPSNLKQLNVNNNEIKLVKLEQNEKETIYDGFIPRKTLKSDKNYTRFTFITKQTLVTDFPLGPIGIAIDKIKIYPDDNSIKI